MPDKTPLRETLTFDDILLVPRYSEITPPEVTLDSWIAPSIGVKIPILSSAMDKVTEARTAIEESVARISSIAIALLVVGLLGIVRQCFTRNGNVVRGEERLRLAFGERRAGSKTRVPLRIRPRHRE